VTNYIVGEESLLGRGTAENGQARFGDDFPRHFIEKELDVFRASEIMTLPVIKVFADESVACALDLMLKHDLSGIPVVNRDGQLVGIFSETDQFGCNYANRSETCVSDVMTTEVKSLDVGDSIVDVAKAFASTRVHRMPVTSGGTVVGVIGSRDLAKFVRDLEHQCESSSADVAKLLPSDEI
jgi:CBS domain-containing protein